MLRLVTKLLKKIGVVDEAFIEGKHWSEELKKKMCIKCLKAKNLFILLLS